jgi:uncharacterized membrane protein YeaQ/YmgE (transglycosylase-associated protein family)
MGWVIDAVQDWISAALGERMAKNRLPWLLAAALIGAILLLAVLLRLFS